MDNQLPRFVTANSWARQTGLSRQTVVSAMKFGQLPTVKIGRRLLIDSATLEQKLSAASIETGSTAKTS